MPVGAAIVGSAVVGAGASVYASSKAAKASQQATDQSVALQKAQYDQTRADNQPFVQAGYAANNALVNRLGLSTPATSAPGVVSSAPANTNQPGVVNSTPAITGSYANTDAFPATSGPPGAPMAGGGNALTNPAAAQPSYSAYLAANPDIAAEAQRVTADGEFPSVQAYLQYHDQTYGNENRPSTPDPTQPQAPLSPAATGDGTQPGTYGNVDNPTYSAPAAYQTPPAYQAPAYKAPAPFSYNLSDYTASPGYQWQQDQAQKAILASNAATGALRSGSALKELQDRAQNIAYQDYSNERNFAYQNYTDTTNRDLSQYNTDRAFNYGESVDNRNFDYGNYIDSRNFGYNKYTDQRNYLTGRYDTQTGNLFNLNNSGQSAAGLVSNAGTNYANNTSNALTSNAGTQGSAYLAAAGQVNNALNNGVKAYTYSKGQLPAAGYANV